MKALVNPVREARRRINEAVRADINLCFTCGSCVAECPVNRATDRLQPRKMVWMANLGLLDELIRSPSIWYCLSCSRCDRVCPMTVKPSALMRYLRWEAIRSGVVAADRLQHLRSIFQRFHCQRREQVRQLLGPGGEAASLSVPIGAEVLRPAGDFLPELNAATDFQSCFACQECSNACPVAHDCDVFDPLRFVRMAVFGLEEALLRSPSLWLCLQCESCTRACGQGVRVHGLIARLRQQAFTRGYVLPAFADQWREREKLLYSRLLDDIDELMGGSS